MLEALLHFLPFPAFVKDREGRYLFVNNAFCLSTGVRREKVKDQTDRQLFDPQIAGEWAKQEEALRHGDERGGGTVRLRNGAWSGRLVRVERKRVDSPGGEVLVGVLTEVAGAEHPEAWPVEKAHLEHALSELREANRLLESTTQWTKEVRANAEMVSAAKNLFLANISHEIRTPMNGILGLTELALGTDLTPEQREYLTIVRSSAESMLELLNDILDFSKCEASKMSLHLRDFHFREQLGWTLKPLAIRARSKGLDFIVNIDPAIPDALHGDPSRVRQILTNLVGNAVKFTESGKVTVTLQLAGDEGDWVTIRSFVADTGVGIPEEKREMVFEPFAQVDGSLARKYGGTGLGLPIAQSLVKLMDGDLSLESEFGAGSVFSFSIRLRRQGVEAGGPQAETGSEQTDADSPKPPALLRKLRILAADDHPVNQLMVRRFLERLGHSVELVQDGEEALERLRSQTYDLVLMDVQMPGMDGLAATAREREREKSTGAHIPIIAMTAHSMPGDRERFLEAGMDGYISKPIRLSDLVTAIHETYAVVTSQREGVTLQPEEFGGLLERTEALARVGNDEELLAEISQLFLEEYEESLAAIRSATHAGDAAGLERAAHHLKGSVANFSSKVRDAAFELEKMGRKGDLGGGSAALDKLVELLERLRPELEALISG